MTQQSVPILESHPYRIVLSPMQNSQTCNVSKRMVPVDATTIAPESNNRLLSFFKKCCCQLCSHETTENIEAIRIYENYLQSRYNNLVLLLANKLTGIDLGLKKAHGLSFFDMEAQSINDKAGIVKGHLQILEKMLKIIVFYHTFIKNKDGLPYSQAHPSKQENELLEIDVNLIVRKSRGNEEPFDEEKIKTYLELLPLKKPLSILEIMKIAHDIKMDLIRSHQITVTTEDLRKRIIDEIKSYEREVYYPEFLASISNPQIVATLLEKTHLDELSKEECEILIIQAEFYIQIQLMRTNRTY